MVVTGSRLRREPGFSGPAPVTTVDAAAIEASGLTQISDVVNQLPGFAVSQTAQTGNLWGNPGVNALDLRGLGVRRTLTLVDGRRQVSSIPGTSSVDLSTIPSSLVERVEVVTGGASAMYGADAVSGVANFILKKDFEGIEGSLRYGDSGRGDMPSHSVDVLFGQNFADYRGNFTFYGFREDSSGEVMGQDRPWTAGNNPVYQRADASQRYQIRDARNIYNAQDAQIVLGDCIRANWSDCLYSFTADGRLRRPDLGPGGITNLAPVDNVLQQGMTDGGEYGGRYDSYYLVTPSERETARASLDFDFNDAARLFTNLTYSKSTAQSAGRALSAYGADIVPAYSPFITQEMIDANGGPLTSGVPFARHFDAEIGQAVTRFDREMLQAVIGLEGDFQIGDRDWTYSGYYSYGRSEQRSRAINSASSTRLQMGLDAYADANGNAVCVSDTPGCVAINPFARLTPEMVDWLTYDTGWSDTRQTQRVASIYATGGVFDLPAGEVLLAVGGEWRKERADIGVIPEFNPADPAYDPTYGSTGTPMGGEYSVKEAFAELQLPLLVDRPFARRLSFDLAGRVSEYSTAGRTTTTKLGAEWAPIDALTFRGTYGKAIRAPNINELYAASVVSGAWITDPCDLWNLDNRTDVNEYTRINCAAINPPGFRGEGDYWQWRDVIASGNLELQPETAKTTTLGFVTRPTFVPNLTLAVDYYRIDLRGVISALGHDTILNRCVDSASMDNQFCDLVTRGDGGVLESVAVQQLNLSQRIARGVDINASWFHDFSQAHGDDAGRLTVSLAAGRILRSTLVDDPAHPEDAWEYSGRFGSPKWKNNLRVGWSNPTWNVQWTLRHLSPMRQGQHVTEELYERVWAGNTFYSDLFASLALGEQVSLFGGMNNLFDRAPPRVPGAESGGANFEYGGNSGVYDSLGRMWNVGIRISM